MDRCRAGHQPFDIRQRLHREIVELEDALYNDRLRPFVEAGPCHTGVCPGVIGQILAHLEQYHASSVALRNATGLVRPHPVGFDIEMFLLLYRKGRLDAWGGAFAIRD